MKAQTSKNTGSEKLYEKYAWILLFVVGILGIIGSYQFLMGTEPDPQYFSSITGTTWDSFVASKQGMVLYVKDALRITGVLFIGLCIMIMAISATAFRKGESWAWYVSWYFPLTLGWITWLLYSRGGSSWSLHMVLSIMALLGLLLPFRKFFINNRKRDSLGRLLGKD